MTFPHFHNFLFSHCFTFSFAARCHHFLTFNTSFLQNSHDFLSCPFSHFHVTFHFSTPSQLLINFILKNRNFKFWFKDFYILDFLALLSVQNWHRPCNRMQGEYLYYIFLKWYLRRHNNHPDIDTMHSRRVIPHWLPLSQCVFIFIFLQYTESIVTLHPFSPIEGQKWFDQISSQWESHKNRFAFISFGKSRFKPPTNWDQLFMTTVSVQRDIFRKYKRT